MELTEEENYIFKKILRNINKEIYSRGIKQEVLAEMMGIRQNHLSEKLSGKNGLKLSFVIKLCNVLDISMLDLFHTEISEGTFGNIPLRGSGHAAISQHFSP